MRTVCNSVEILKKRDKFSKRLLEKVKNKEDLSQMEYSTQNDILQLEEAESMLKKTIEKYENKTSGFAEWLEHEIPEGLTVFNIVPDSIGVRRKLRTANMIEFQNKELKKRTRCIKLFPNRESLLRIATALLIELDETWLSESKRYI